MWNLQINQCQQLQIEKSEWFFFSTFRRFIEKHVSAKFKRFISRTEVINVNRPFFREKQDFEHSCLFLKFIYSGKATKFWETFILLLSYVVPVKSKVKISQNFVAFSKYMNFTYFLFKKYSRLKANVFQENYCLCHVLRQLSNVLL